ncbi:MAG: hypothetical protein C3F02_02435 [Parcubacteria group bacterium]|nr:MAG: hypothetical protein C3F02_02435 [Parcubacteria group bacterium]
MFLILYIKDHNHGCWLILEKGTAKYLVDFEIARGEDNSLKFLDHLLKRYKLNWKAIGGLGLIIDGASLTQVKVFTTMINIVAWQFRIPVAGIFYSPSNIDKKIASIFTQLKKQKNFRVLKVKYNQKADITISKRRQSYKIIK